MLTYFDSCSRPRLEELYIAASHSSTKSVGKTHTAKIKEKILKTYSIYILKCSSVLQSKLFASILDNFLTTLIAIETFWIKEDRISIALALRDSIIADKMVKGQPERLKAFSVDHDIAKAVNYDTKHQTAPMNSQAHTCGQNVEYPILAECPLGWINQESSFSRES